MHIFLYGLFDNIKIRKIDTHILWVSTYLPVPQVSLEGRDQHTLQGPHLFQVDRGNLAFLGVQDFPGVKEKQPTPLIIKMLLFVVLYLYMGCTINNCQKTLTNAKNKQTNKQIARTVIMFCEWVKLTGASLNDTWRGVNKIIYIKAVNESIKQIPILDPDTIQVQYRCLRFVLELLFFLAFQDFQVAPAKAKLVVWYCMINKRSWWFKLLPFHVIH